MFLEASVGAVERQLEKGSKALQKHTDDEAGAGQSGSSFTAYRLRDCEKATAF